MYNMNIMTRDSKVDEYLRRLAKTSPKPVSEKPGYVQSHRMDRDIFAIREEEEILEEGEAERRAITEEINRQEAAKIAAEQERI